MKKIKQSESGRTMVEMLGTLAIIGILSVGGVTGYGRAITAHRANTAIETAQREAAIVAGEIATGQKVEPESATVLRASTGYEVAVKDVVGGTTDITNQTPFFGVEVGGGSGEAVQRAVAKSIVERAAEDWTNVQGIGVVSGEGESRTIKWLKSAGTGANGFETEVPESAQTVILIIVYAFDLAPRTGDLLTDFALPVDPNVCDPECNSCRLCHEGQCVVDEDKDGVAECTTTNNKTGTCSNGECVATPVACLDNSACDTGEFCDVGIQITTPQPGTTITWYGPAPGVCEQITSNDYIAADISGINVRSSKTKMNYFAAQNWCQSQGKTAQFISWMGCPWSSGQTTMQACTNSKVSEMDAAFGHLDFLLGYRQAAANKISLGVLILRDNGSIKGVDTDPSSDGLHYVLCR